MKAHDPNLTLSPAYLRTDYAPLPQPIDGKPVTLLNNHVDVAKAYHLLLSDHVCLVLQISQQQGVTINGQAPKPGVSTPQACDGVNDKRDINSSLSRDNYVDK